MLQFCKRLALLRRFSVRPFSDSSKSKNRSVIEAYHQHIASNGLYVDQRQLSVIKLLDRLSLTIEQFKFQHFDSKEISSPAKTTQENPHPKSQSTERIRGLYLYGPVGVGKTMVMDLFFDSCNLEQKRRVHFHQFMLNVHRSIHEHKQCLLAKYGRSRHVDLSPEHDSIRQVGYQIASETKLLCFDEFQVTDISDALMLTKLFDAMWSRGLVLVATSNRPPTDLYLDGINRPDFLPFIEQLQMECIVRKLDNGKDYRLLSYEQHQQQQSKSNDHSRSESRFMSPIADKLSTQFRSGFVEEVRNRRENDFFATSDNITTTPEIDPKNHNNIRLPIQGNRYFSLPKHDIALDVGVCYVDFAMLCEMDRGAVDYHALCQYFQVVYLHGIPKLTRKQHDATRRFIILIDELYNHHVKLVCLAEAKSPHEMYSTFTEPLLSDTNSNDDQGAVSSSGSSDDSGEGLESVRGEGVLETSIPFESYGRNHTMPIARLTEVATIGQQEEINVMESELSSIKDLDFAFQRATSRVTEMLTWQ